MTIKTFFLPANDEPKAEAVAHLMCAYVADMIRAGKKTRIRIDQSVSKRSLEQNAISHSWYQQLADELPEDNALGWKCFCKLNYGIPIMRAEEDEFREACDRVLAVLPYESQLLAMKYWPVTSIMTTKQLSQYAESVQDHFARRGVKLEFQEPTR